MSFGENIAPLVGRALIALFFVLTAWNQVQHWNATAVSMAAHGMSFIQPKLALAVVVEFGAGFGLLVGFRTKLMALALFVFTLIVSFLMHDYWAIKDAEASFVQLQLFTRNMAIAGGLLILVGLGAGGWSYDSMRGDD